jgi:hypothetical protein
MGMWLVELKVVEEVERRRLVGFEQGFAVEVHHYPAGGVGAVDRNGLVQPNQVQVEFDHTHLTINSIDSIVESHEVLG